LQGTIKQRQIRKEKPTICCTAEGFSLVFRGKTTLRHLRLLRILDGNPFSPVKPQKPQQLIVKVCFSRMQAAVAVPSFECGFAEMRELAN